LGKELVMSNKLGSKLDQALAEADEIEAAERTTDPNAPLPAHVKVSQPGRARSKVLQVRLNPEEMVALEAIAEQRGLPVSTVAREQILRLLNGRAAEADPLCGLIEAADRVREFAVDLREHFPHGLVIGGAAVAVGRHGRTNQ
jgi:hypothetical protein